MYQKQILSIAVLAILAVAASGCGLAESSEFETVTSAEIAQAEAVQLKPKPLNEYLTDTPAGSPNDAQADPNVGTNSAQASNDANQQPTEPANPNADEVVDATDNSIGSPTTVKLDNEDEDADLRPSVSQKGAAFLEQQQLLDRLKTVEPREIKLLVTEKTFRSEGPEDALRVSFDDVDLLKILNMDPVPANARQMFPEWLKSLDGKRIRIRGFMYPPYRDTGLKAFVVARDNQICCFGKSPKIYDLINVLMRKGETTDYIQGRPFDVVGVLHMEESEFAGEMFWMDDATVIDK